MSAPCLLALDAATAVVHVGLQAAGGQQVLALPAGAAASTGLLPALQALLREAGLSWPQFDAIAFGRGPGAFTGLRTAAAVAQGLALGAQRPVIALDTLLAVAEDARQTAAALPAGSVFWALTDARMGEIYAAAWRHTPIGWQPVAAPALWPPAALASALAQAALESQASASPLVAAGNALAVYADAFVALPPTVHRVPDAQPRGAALLALAQADWMAGRTLDAALALPLYVRDKVAETTAERAQRADRAQAVAGAAPAA